MRKIPLLFFALIASQLLVGAAHGQTMICYKTGNTAPGCQVVTPAAPLPVTATVAGTTTATQGTAGTNANAWWVQIGDTTNGPAAVPANGVDGGINSQNGLQTYDRPSWWNGANWDRATGDTATGLRAILTSQYPKNANGLAAPLTASATGTTAATTATLVGTASKTTFICGFSITADATVGVAGTATVVGTTGGTMSFIQSAGVAPAVSELSKTFSPCIPASAANTAITVNSIAAGGSGNTAVTAWGYQL